MTDAAPRTLTVDDLQPGDLPMSMARTELAKLIAWIGDTSYSHAAVVFSKDDLVWVPPQHPPMPEFDLVELHHELRDLLGPAAPAGMVPATATGPELAASYACLRTRFGAGRAGRPAQPDCQSQDRDPDRSAMEPVVPCAGPTEADPAVHVRRKVMSQRSSPAANPSAVTCETTKPKPA